MIQGIEDRESLTRDAILKRISPSDVFQYYVGNFRLGRAIKSKFRDEMTPSMLINEGSGGELRFIDLGDDKYHGDCFDLVGMMFGLDFKETLVKINQDFGLGIGDLGPVKDYKQIISSFKRLKPKKPAKIEPVLRPYTLAEIEWWNRHLQSTDDLKADYIFGLEALYLNDKKMPQSKHEMAFAYHFPRIDKWKIYFPERYKTDDFFQQKWYSNVPTSVIERQSNLSGASKGIVGKSRKDRMTLSKFLPHVCSVQNESRSAFTDEVRTWLDAEVDEVLLSFDNDAPGKKSAGRLQEEYGYGLLFTPDNIPYKDWGGWVYDMGPQPMEKYLKNQGLL